jgi:hypothetical protein
MKETSSNRLKVDTNLRPMTGIKEIPGEFALLP